jgi:Tfp pilus assembly protein PilP
MRPNFALNFTSAGLALFHRTSTGWARVGDVNLASENLETDLAHLMQSAQVRDPMPMHCKLIIPNDQIRYIAIETGDVTEIDRRDMVMRALVGQTPYHIEELAFSWSVSGGFTQIAAVARETLEEAEGFASQYGFNPVSFVAIPEPGVYSGEAYFGPTYFATQELGGEIVERDVVQLPMLEDVVPADSMHTPVIPASSEADLSTRPLLILPEILFPRRRDIMGPEALTPQIAPHIETTSAVKTDSTRQQTSLPELGSAHQSTAGSTGAQPALATMPLRPAEDEAEQMTIFGARGAEADPPAARRKMTVLLICFVILGAAGAALLSSDHTLGLFPGQTDADVSVDVETSANGGTPSPSQSVPSLETATQGIPSSDIDLPDLGETVAPAPAPPLSEMPLRADPATPAEASARYAATGIWQRAPTQSVAPIPSELGDIRFSEVSPTDRVKDVVGLPSPEARPEVGTGLQPPPNPPAADQKFALDARGFVAGTSRGAMTPQGHLVYLGAPSKVPPPRPDATKYAALSESLATPDAAPTETGAPSETDAQAEPASAPTPDTSALPPPGQLHPKARPEDLVTAVIKEADPEEVSDLEETGSELATAEAVRPRARPNDFAASIAAAQAASRPIAEPQIQAPTVQPPGPTRASVAKEATEKNALKLNAMNLLGVMGKPSNRSALVRLSNGRILKVKVGDKLDGGRVAAIGADELRYIKSNRNLTLRMPKDG